MLAGFGNANLGTAQAIMSDISDRNSRAKAMGLIGAAFGLGFVLGPAIGGILGQYGAAAPAFAAAALGGINLVAAYVWLPETLVKSEVSKQKTRRFSWQAFKHATRHTNVMEIFLTTLVAITAFAMMEQIVGLFIEFRWLGLSASHDAHHVKAATELTSYFLVAVGVVAIFVQGGMIGPLSRKFGEANICRAGLATMAVAMALVPVLIDGHSMPLMLLCAAILAFGKGLYNPSSTGLLSLSVDADEQGSILGMNQSIAALGRVIGPSIAGILFETQETLPFFISAAMIGIAATVAIRLRAPTASRDSA